jgi:hypothetical protein
MYSRLFLFVISLGFFTIAYNVAVSEAPYYLDNKASIRFISSTAAIIHGIFGQYGASAFFVCLGLIFLYFIFSLRNIDYETTLPSLSRFTKILLIFIGIPLLSLMLSAYIVRFFQLFEISIDTTSIVLICTFTSWIFGIYKCKSDYFKKPDIWH